MVLCDVAVVGGVLGPKETYSSADATAGLVRLRPPMTQNVISPGLNAARPTQRSMSSHCGARIDDTETRFCCSMSALRRAYSNAGSWYRWTPTPRVRNTHLGLGNMASYCRVIRNACHRPEHGRGATRSSGDAAAASSHAIRWHGACRAAALCRRDEPHRHAEPLALERQARCTFGLSRTDFDTAPKVLHMPHLTSRLSPAWLAQRSRPASVIIIQIWIMSNTVITPYP